MADGSRAEHAREALQKKNLRSISRPPGPEIYLFFSFDLVNSTLFKAQYPERWPIVVTHFYEILQSNFNTSQKDAHLWKYVGDEVLFYISLANGDELLRSLKAAFKTLRATEEVLHAQYTESRELLSIKAAAWVALAAPITPGATNAVHPNSRNIIVSTGKHPGYQARDFLGPDIDIGFRVARYAMRRRLVVSAHLAALIFHQASAASEVGKHFRIVSYEKLKGVWADRHYPIIWFEESWEKIQDTFQYDESLVSPLAQAAINAASDPQRDLSAVKRIFKDVCKEREIEDLISALKNLPKTKRGAETIDIPISKYAEVHCVAVCFSPTGEVLAARRPSTKRRFPCAFEFGCGQLKLGESFADCLRRAYLDDFGVEIELEGVPTPVSTFLIHDSDEERVIPGVIFAAQISDKTAVETKFAREKHDEVQWLALNSLDAPAQGKFVPGFADTVRKAHAVWLAALAGKNASVTPSKRARTRRRNGQ